LEDPLLPYHRVMRIDEYSRHDAVALAELVARGEVTSAELQELALQAHQQTHAHINAVVEFNEPDQRPVVESGALAGVPMMVKDLFHGQPGQVCGNGSRLSQGWAVSHPSQIYSRAVRGGLVNVGRTTTSEFGIMGTTETIAQGPTRSPWNPEHIAGGSSGGAGAVVGAGVVPVALASDGGGSIRIPASACGTVGLKPSRGRVPWGLRLREPLMGWAVQFAITRSVRDSALLLDLLGGPTPGDPEAVDHHPMSYYNSHQSPPARLRIAWTTDPWSGQGKDPVLHDAVVATVDLLEQLGHEVTAAAPRFDWELFQQATANVWAATNAHTIDGFAAMLGRPVNRDTLEGPTLATVLHGRRVTGEQLLTAMDLEVELTHTMASFFTSFDILVTPTLGAPVPQIGHYDPHSNATLDETLSAWSRWESFLPAFNTTGQPAISLPLHQTPTGLPIGIQLVAATGREDLLLSLAATLESALPWAGRTPPVFAGHM